VVVWLFAGGGEAEIRGLIPFFMKHYPQCSFIRKTPILRKPGPRPGRELHSYGQTGESLVSEIKKQLTTALLNEKCKCDFILVIDDLDCNDKNIQTSNLNRAIDSVQQATAIKRFIGFASPEFEAWIIADWDNSLAKDVDFRGRHLEMKYFLIREKRIPFNAPESFGVYDAAKKSCNEKMSDAIIEASIRQSEKNIDQCCYSKATHSPRMLQMIDPDTVRNKCPLFKGLCIFIEDQISQANPH